MHATKDVKKGCILNDFGVTAEVLLHLLDAATGRVMFFDTGQEHEYPNSGLE